MLGVEYLGACEDCIYALFRNGTSTDSSISSYVFNTAGSRISGWGGRSEGARAMMGSRTSEGRLTSRDPLG